MPDLLLYNTLTRQKQEFKPLDDKRVTLYACGPTVYNYVHIGNGRMLVVFDTLFRILRHKYGTDHVVYARNITDIDDKIMQQAEKEGCSTDEIATRYTEVFLADMDNVGNLRPNFMPKATDYIRQQIAMVEALIDKGHAYEREGHVLFNVPSYAEYGKLSRRSRDEQIAGARVEVAPYKKDPADFVLWKPSTDEQPGWDSPWGRGRPGWHLECSVMSTDILGENFDIHGGGQDLTFPHHENEIAQSCCAHEGSTFAQVWMHNGMLNINGEKMSKSLGNFKLLHDLLQHYDGEVVRYVLLSAHYRQPAEFGADLLDEAKKTLDRWYNALSKLSAVEAEIAPTDAFVAALYDDMNTPKAFAELHHLFGELNKAEGEAQATLKGQLFGCAQLIGLLEKEPTEWLRGGGGGEGLTNEEIDALVAERIAAKDSKDYARADEIRNQLTEAGIILEDGPAGTAWRRS